MGQETEENKSIGGKTAGGKSCDQSTRAWDRFHPETRRKSGSNHSFPWVTNPRGASISDEGDCFPPPKPIDDLLTTLRLIEAKVANHRFLNLKMAQELPGVPSILRRHKITVP